MNKIVKKLNYNYIIYSKGHLSHVFDVTSLKFKVNISNLEKTKYNKSNISLNSNNDLLLSRKYAFDNKIISISSELILDNKTKNLLILDNLLFNNYYINNIINLNYYEQVKLHIMTNICNNFFNI